VAGCFASIHADQVARALAAGEATRSALVASWQRSSGLHRLDPAAQAPPQRLSAGRLREARQAMEALLRAAQPALDRLFLAVGGVGCSALLADRHGVPLDRRGAVADDETFDAWGLWTGAIWSEDAEGTNGIGTCLVEQRALTIHREQHFFARNALMSCTTAPIFDENGDLVAALDVSSCRADLTDGFVNLIAMAVADAARRIEVENFRQAFPKSRIVVAPTPERAGAALLAVSADDLVVGATRGARVALDLTSAALAEGLPASDLIGGFEGGAEDFPAAERAVLRRTLARAHGNVSKAAKALAVSRATLHRKMSRLGIQADG
jgi:transcriptional regulator of acetoin/glycerol metabolism